MEMRVLAGNVHSAQGRWQFQQASSQSADVRSAAEEYIDIPSQAPQSSIVLSGKNALCHFNVSANRLLALEEDVVTEWLR